ncbi:MAG: type II toxin-antitoxin system VapB family antitoxin [Geminicoccaceae bacterium]
MVLYIKDPETELMVRELAELTGEKITDAVKAAIGDRLDKARRPRDHRDVARIQAIVRAYQSKPVVDPRAPDDVLYGTDGLPGCIAASAVGGTAPG